MKESVTVSEFGTLPDGREVSQYTMTNSHGVVMKVINYGGIITSILVPDKNGDVADVVLGHDNLQGYIDNNSYLGALIGRFGNRIAKGEFQIDGSHYSLATNNGPNHLHGGVKGFDKVYWNITEEKIAGGVALRLQYTSADMEEGYPGTLTTEVMYTLTNDNDLKIDYTATTTSKTITNLTQHTYFNLTGVEHDVLRHELKINAEKFLPVDSTLIPTGELQPVSHTPFDFTTPSRIGSRINENSLQLQYGNGYDHCWVLNEAEEPLKLAAILYEPISGREMIVYTTEPGVQFYSGNFLDGSATGKNGKKYSFRTGLCLETQHFPDSPNKPNFPNVLLAPGDTLTSQTVYHFGVRNEE
ncbi:MAG TPA: aldose epimerase family protein [Chryseosolibacter sp.]|nr:aldose epimerase family protein [Chryseosolibacter sp.]